MTEIPSDFFSHIKFPLYALILFFLLIFEFQSGHCEQGSESEQVHGDASYRKPRPLDFVKKVPSDLKTFGKKVASKESVPAILWIVGTTGLLLLVDQRLVNTSHDVGSDTGITHTNYQKTLFSIPVGKSNVGVEGPFDSGSALYFIGDGTVDVILAGSFLTHGLVASNNRSLQTSSQIVEAILAAGLVAQGIKHITGRGSPFTTEETGGHWQFFPSPKKYAGHVATYDAFPSGHLTASMATLTVLAENYPEHRWIRPVGYTLFGVLGFQMLNNGVHWASDYPLALALGYSFGKIITSRERRPIKDDEHADIHFLPFIGNNVLGGQFVWRFSGKSPSKKEHS